MRLAAPLVAGLAAIAAGALAWGYWHAARHADVQLQVNDHGLASRTQLYGTPHDVTLVLRDASGAALATARSVEPAGYLLAVHPDPAIGNCQHIGRQPEYGECYARYSAWLSGWAPKVAVADVSAGACTLRNVPVATYRSGGDWWLWWVPLPHIGGEPRRYYGFIVSIDSRKC